MLVKKGTNHLLFTSIGPVAYYIAIFSITTSLLNKSTLPQPSQYFLHTADGFPQLFFRSRIT